MIEIHTIRLRGPWQCETGSRTERIHMPVRRDTLVSDDYCDRLCCHRRFGCPTCLDPHERVWLVIDQPVRPGEASLNGQQLGTFQLGRAATEFDVTDQLKERNVLVLDFDFSHTEAATSDMPATCISSHPAPTANKLLFRDVRLEIRG